MASPNGAIEVPAGGGTTILLAPSPTFNESWLEMSPTLVMPDGLLVAGADVGHTQSVIWSFASATVDGGAPALAAWGTGGAYFDVGFTLLLDANGSVLRPGLVGNAGPGVGILFSSDGMTSQNIDWLPGEGAVIAPTSVYEANGVALQHYCFDGSGGETIASLPNDETGLALGADGSLFYAEFFTNPSNLTQLSADGATATVVTSVPMGVQNLVIDPTGTYLYVAGLANGSMTDNVGNTVWQVTIATGDKVVYGCDPASTRACGATN